MQVGAWKALLAQPDDPTSPDHAQTILYKARALIAQNKTSQALSILPTDDTSLSVRAVRSLARYVSKKDTDKALEELRDLCVEIEEEGVDAEDKNLVKVVAGTAFAREGEIEEALETLGAGGNTENLDACVLGLVIQ